MTPHAEVAPRRSRRWSIKTVVVLAVLAVVGGSRVVETVRDLEWRLWSTKGAPLRDLGLLASLSAEARFERGLGERFGVFEAIKRRIPEDSVIGVMLAPGDPESATAFQILGTLTYPRRFQDLAALERHFVAHPEEVSPRVWVLILDPNWVFPMAEYFDHVESADGWRLYRYAGVPK